uniref:UDENN domain-containing protein n=1 Tax=Corethron hystrix TaxID=216773 RepID=A0A7S1C1A4_9STRA
MDPSNTAASELSDKRYKAVENTGSIQTAVEGSRVLFALPTALEGGSDGDVDGVPLIDPSGTAAKSSNKQYKAVKSECSMQMAVKGSRDPRIPPSVLEDGAGGNSVSCGAAALRDRDEKTGVGTWESASGIIFSNNVSTSRLLRKICVDKIRTSASISFVRFSVLASLSDASFRSPIIPLSVGKGDDFRYLFSSQLFIFDEAETKMDADGSLLIQIEGFGCKRSSKFNKEGLAMNGSSVNDALFDFGPGLKSNSLEASSPTKPSTANLMSRWNTSLQIQTLKINNLSTTKISGAKHSAKSGWLKVFQPKQQSDETSAQELAARIAAAEMARHIMEEEEVRQRNEDLQKKQEERQQEIVWTHMNLGTVEVVSGDGAAWCCSDDGDIGAFVETSRHDTGVYAVTAKDDEENEDEVVSSAEVIGNSPSSPRDLPQVESLLEPGGIVDCVCVVGAKNCGTQAEDDGRCGWVNSRIEMNVLEFFPIGGVDERLSLLPSLIFPEGPRLFRSSCPPRRSDLTAFYKYTSSPSSSAYKFDLLFNCATTFHWFVFEPMNETQKVKRYGASIRFYSMAPKGVDRKQADYASFLQGNSTTETESKKRLWIPCAITVLSHHPEIDLMENILYRLCTNLSTTCHRHPLEGSWTGELHNLMEYPAPLPGILHISIPFFEGSPLTISTNNHSLPEVVHGSAIVQTVKQMTPHGFLALLASLLCEHHTILLARNPSLLSTVAEVSTSLLHPMRWVMPYYPCIWEELMPALEAPFIYFAGVPACLANLVEPYVWNEVNVFDLDASTYVEGGESIPKWPKQLYDKLLEACNELLKTENFLRQDPNYFPQEETLHERTFRISVACAICELLTGIEHSISFREGAHPVLGSGLFLDHKRKMGAEEDMIEFCSVLINTQSFQTSILESLFMEGDDDPLGFLHERNDLIREGCTNVQQTLSEILQGMEDVVPTYKANRTIPYVTTAKFCCEKSRGQIWHTLFSNIVSNADSTHPKGGKITMSLEMFVELEERPWKYIPLFASSFECHRTPISIREAMGERRYERYCARLDKSIDRNDGQEDPQQTTPQLARIKTSQIVTDDIRTPQRRLLDDRLLNSVLNGAFDPNADEDTTETKMLLRQVHSQELLRYTNVREVIWGVLRGRARGEDDVATWGDYCRIKKCRRNNYRRMAGMSVQARTEEKIVQMQQRETKVKAPDDVVTVMSNIGFEILGELCRSLLNFAQKEENYAAAYDLLSLSANFCTNINATTNTTTQHFCPCFPSSATHPQHILTSVLIDHPIYSSVHLWEDAMLFTKSPSNHEKDVTISILSKMVKFGMHVDFITMFAHWIAVKRKWEDDDRAEVKDACRQICKSAIDRLSTKRAIEMENVDAYKNPYEECCASLSSTEESDVSWQRLAWRHPSMRLLSLASSPSSRGEDGCTNIANYGGSVPITSVAILDNMVCTGGADGSIFWAYNLPFETGEVIRGIRLNCDFKPGCVGGGVSHVAMIRSTSNGSTRSNCLSKKKLEWEDLEFTTLIGCSASGILRTWNLHSLYGFAERLEEDTSNANNTISSSLSHLHGTNLNPYSKEDSFAGRLYLGHSPSIITCLDIPSSVYRPHQILTGGSDGKVKLWSTKGVDNTSGAEYHANEVQHRRASWYEKNMTSSSQSNANVSPKTSMGTEAEAKLVLNGHTCEIRCLQSVWYGDQLSTGDTDGTVRVWDLEKCGRAGLSSLGGGDVEVYGRDDALLVWRGHTSSVTKVQYWTTNTLLSASHDGTIQLWDCRSSRSNSKKSCLTLSANKIPFSDMMLTVEGKGEESQYGAILVVTSTIDGTINSWDLRKIQSPSLGESEERNHRHSPLATMQHYDNAASCRGPITISNGISAVGSVISSGMDNTVREWNVGTGDSCHQSFLTTIAGGYGIDLTAASLQKHRLASVTLSGSCNVGHKDAITCIKTCGLLSNGSSVLGGGSGRTAASGSLMTMSPHHVDRSLHITSPVVKGGMVTCSWDGVVRVQRLISRSGRSPVGSRRKDEKVSADTVETEMNKGIEI